MISTSESIWGVGFYGLEDEQEVLATLSTKCFTYIPKKMLISTSNKNIRNF